MHNNSTRLTQLSQEDMNAIRLAEMDVLKSNDQKLERERKLYQALILGNRYKSHVKIKCRNRNHRLMEVRATVWAVTDSHVFLKSARLIPIRDIVDVTFI